MKFCPVGLRGRSWIGWRNIINNKKYFTSNQTSNKQNRDYELVVIGVVWVIFRSIVYSIFYLGIFRMRLF